MKKWLFILVLIVLSGGIFFSFKTTDFSKKPAISTAEITTQEELEETNLSLNKLADKYNSCSASSDCVYVPLSACPCQMKGNTGVINTKHKEKFLSKIPTVDAQLCAVTNLCSLEEIPVCHQQKCFLNARVVLQTALNNNDMANYTSLLETLSWDISKNSDILLSDIITSPHTESDKIAYIALLLQKGFQPKYDFYTRILNQGQLEVAEYLLKNSSIPKTISNAFFAAYYQNQPGLFLINEESPSKQEQKRRFPLENGFSLDCGNACAEIIPLVLKNASNKTETTLFLMALGALPKTNLNTKSLEQHVKNCTDLTQPCGSVKKALDLVLPFLEVSSDDTSLAKLLQPYRSCKFDTDCEPLTFGTCSQPVSATAINKQYRTHVFLDKNLQQQAQRALPAHSTAQWCLEETQHTQSLFRVSCQNKICSTHPIARMNIIVW